jgi:hypothetical protein
MVCDGCGGARFELSDTFAAVGSGGAAEVAVWTCRVCGDRVEEETGAPGPNVEPLSSVA